MKVLKPILLYLLAAFYVLMGALHFVQPQQYEAMMPPWLPFHSALIYLSGAVEIGLGLLLLWPQTRALAAKLIIAMLVVFFVAIHVPQSAGYYQTHHPDFIASIVRLPIQFLFIAWAWLFAKKQA